MATAEMSERIRALRNDLKLTQKQFAWILGSKEQSVKNYELKLRKVPVEFVSKIAAVTTMSVSELFNATERDSTDLQCRYKKGALFIKFDNDSWFKFPSVPDDVFSDLMNAESKSDFYEKHIKGKFHGYRTPSPIDEENKTPYDLSSDNLVKYV